MNRYRLYFYGPFRALQEWPGQGGATCQEINTNFANIGLAHAWAQQAGYDVIDHSKRGIA